MTASSTPTTVDIIRELRQRSALTAAELAQCLGTSLLAFDRWERGAVVPSPRHAHRIASLLDDLRQGKRIERSGHVLQNGLLASRGSTRQALRGETRDLFAMASPVAMNETPLAPILSRLKHGRFFGDGERTLAELLARHARAAPTPDKARIGGTSAGKNTYTYDAHTYHTKVPPQGIVEFIEHYLPAGGLMLDAFAGSGMTGVAARVAGVDAILNELSPAACFIAHEFTAAVSPQALAAALRHVLDKLAPLRRALYGTVCRECGKDAEVLYTVWSYRVRCGRCSGEFLLWDHCRRYGKTVREHKILSEFPCPCCGETIKKSGLARFAPEPVRVGYKCCGGRQVEHPPSEDDRAALARISAAPPLAEGFFPRTPLPDGVNLNQPKRHGLDTIDRFYTLRNLAAMSHLWREIHRLEDSAVAGMVAFVFTSLYQRVTRLSEFRFWGGSGNTARFNVPYLSNEANVFATFERKAASIVDHLETTAAAYRGNRVVACNTATRLDYLPDACVDFVFTDPPFGANINYSEMNILWESWLGEFTNATDEAIVNRVQGKTLADYEELMARALSECHRVLRPGHWLLLVFMNSSGQVWESLRSAVRRAGFAPERVDIFDKQHGSFKQFASANAAGCDLVLHCRKPVAGEAAEWRDERLSTAESVAEFLRRRGGGVATTVYLHVARPSEPDFRTLYSEWVAYGLPRGHDLADFAVFRTLAEAVIEGAP